VIGIFWIHGIVVGSEFSEHGFFQPENWDRPQAWLLNEPGNVLQDGAKAF